MSQQSNLTFFVKSTLTIASGTGATFNISNDNELGGVIEFTTNTSIVLKNDTQLERMIITATGGVATIVLRGLTQADAEAEDAGLKKQWNDGDSGYMTPLAFDIVDRGADNIFEGLQTFTDIDFKGTTTGGLKTKSLTTVERDAITNVSNGMIVYNTTDGVHNQYIGGTWSDFATGSVVNADETTAGKVEIATDAEIQSQTDTGGTSAKLSVLPSQINPNKFTTKTTLVDGDELMLSDSEDSNKTKKVTFNNIKATSLEVVARTDDSVFLTPAGYTEGNRDQIQSRVSLTSGITSQATANGFVHGWCTAPSLNNFGTISVVSDSNATPTTNVGQAGGNGGTNVIFCIPILKDDYYKTSHTTNGAGTVNAYFTALN